MDNRRRLAGFLLATAVSAVLGLASAGAAHGAGPVEAADSDSLHIVNQGSGKCFDVVNQSTSPGAKLQQVGCKDIGGQRFTFVSAGNGTYNIVAANTGLCVDVIYAGSGNFVPTQLWYCNGAGNQRFAIVDVGAGPVQYHALEPAHVSGYCLRADPQRPLSDNAAVMQFSCNGDSAEHWRWY
jgi:endoglucanase